MVILHGTWFSGLQKNKHAACSHSKIETLIKASGRYGSRVCSGSERVKNIEM